MVNEIKEFDTRQWVKVRSSLDGSQTFLTWTGSIYSFVPNEKKKRLFNIVGMSVSRCIENDDKTWEFTSRELTYYLDPNTNEILHKWENPWTGETLTVIHVANSPVEGHFKGNFPGEVNGDITTFVFDLFPTYPNSLAEDEKFQEYSPQQTYQAAELFKLTVPTEELDNPEILSVSKMFICWDRIGPWLPWMKMADRAGHLIYSATGQKVKSFNDLPQLLQDEINTRMSLYKNAPKAPLDSDMTSWIYFKKHFEAYLAGERFPIPEAEEE
ncbi:DUF1838 domain-containing protein [Aerosakkonema funiforme]|uniref:DUF1838 domain-containing protein n=2 Tax=Oscillatoriophycideae TaxID=1301283 RepID=A0A926VJX0_9CYAN|nr:DUF1838 domain-containing protein [Aerosakkonema funiforme]MBD2185237.1 DUF1838 domain-containing protein [Aerosakkonema funiforme FACHB-1375]